MPFIRQTPTHSNAAKEELFLHITPLPHESPADALTRNYNLSPRDIDTIANNLLLDSEQKQNLPQRCCPLDLQHHIQTELMRRVHLGIDIGIPHQQLVASQHRRFPLSDSPFTFEIRETKPMHGEEKHSSGKHAFKKPVADLSEQLGHETEKKSATWMAGFAGNGDHFASTTSNGFALSYAVMKLVLVGQYFIVWIHAPNSRCRRPILFYMLANFISFIMWWTSAFLIGTLTPEARYGIWFSAIGIEVFTTIALTNNATVTFLGSHLPERLGLFTLIILGESIMGLFMITDDLVDTPGKLGWDNLILLIFSITIVKCQWFLYFDDYHEQGPARSAIHSALWTYLHFMLNLSQLLLGVGCLDLIRVYQLKRPSVDVSDSSLIQHIKSVQYPDEAAGAGSANSPNFGAEGLESDSSHDVVLVYVKKYYLIVAASVFFWNATIKCVTSRPGDKYDRAIYISRYFMSFVVLCLLLVEHEQLGAFSLLGLEVGSCLLQVGHDLLVLYYAARKDIDEQCDSLQ
ncbi:hypothetical protein BGZ46_008623 [Entomortierella lignicola]|nr:hypothetical protein BGZ46_008623 [Entomortierella lignicola]